MVFGVNDRDQATASAWVEGEALPFPVLLDPDRTIALAFGMSKAGDERYLADPSEGKRPAVIIDEQGIVLRLLPDLATVDGQKEILTSLA